MKIIIVTLCSRYSGNESKMETKVLNGSRNGTVNALVRDDHELIAGVEGCPGVGSIGVT